MRTAAGWDYEVVVNTSQFIAPNDAPPHGAIVVASLAWAEAQYADRTGSGVLSAARFVLLLPADASGERHQWGARIAPNALLVVTKLQGTPLALHDALRAVRHNKVAEVLVGRIGSSCNDLPTRALVAAVRLNPAARDVPTLARVLHMSERTLRRQLDSLCPTLAPHRLPNWACLLHTAWYLGAHGESFERIASHVGASAPSNLHRMLRCYTGYSASDMRTASQDPVTTVLAAWRAEISGAKAALHTRRWRVRAADGADPT